MASFGILSRRELIRTAQAIRERENRIERARQEQSLLDFVRYFWDVLEPGREFVEGEVIAAMCEHLEAVADGTITRLLENVPPGFMKSLLTNVFFPAWLWGPKNRASTRIVAFSYSAHLTERDNAKFRDLVKSRKYQELWGHRVSLTEDGKVKVSNSATGFKFASSVGGVGTGERGDIVLCFPAEVRVWTENGPQPIGELVRSRVKVRVWSEDIETKEISLKPVVGWLRNPGSRLVRVTLSDGATVECTPDHRIWTENRGWVEARHLESSDRLPNQPALDGKDQPRSTSDATVVANRIKFFKTGYRTPLLVEFVGHADETFCLTVADNHTFYVGDDKILVANCDDLHNVKEAESETVRRETCRWFREALQNRLNDPENSAIIVIMQRVHEEDVSGVILAEYPEYTHFCVPMEYEEGRHCETEIGWSDWRTHDGQLAWPERFPEHTLAPFKRLPFLWAGQYQQRPEPRGGGILKREWWQDWNDEAAAYYGIKPGAFPPMELIIASLDPAYTEKEENDPSALTIWGLWRDRQDNPMVMLMNAWQKRLEIHGPLVEREPNESEHSFLERTKPEWGLVEWVTHSCNRFKVDKLLIEAKASGHSVYQEIKRLNRYASWTTSLIDPGRQDKVARAYAVQPHFANAQVFAPLSRGWADEVVSQAASFPKGTHDDLVDSAGQALRWLRDQGFLRRPDEIVADFTAENTHQGRSRPIYDV